MARAGGGDDSNASAVERTAWHDEGVDDRALVDAVLAGDRDLFRVLVEREQVTVYRTCLRILGRPHDAEDVAQESFVMAYRSLGTYRGEGPLGGWLLRIATRQAYRRLGQRRETAELQPELTLERSAPTRSPSRWPVSGSGPCGWRWRPWASRIARSSRCASSPR